MADKANDPSTPSLAHEKLSAHWQMIRAILAGAKAVKAAGEKYLPKFPAESDPEYNRRKESAPWRPEFEDCIRSISAKPFAEETKLAGEPSDEMKAIAEDIDGRGNNLHVFARDMFEGGVSLGAHGILVDFPTMNPNATRAEEKAAGARPYWVSVDADEIIALRTERRGAREVVVHLRLRETAIVVDGFEEKAVEKIRVIEPGMWQLWKQVKTAAGETTWEIESDGILTLDEVPFVFYATAERVGAQYVRPPLLDLATMQIELYQALSTKEQAYTMLGAPMLSANGMAAPDDGSSVETGPRRILFAPGAEGISTSWSILSAPAGSLKELREDCAATAEDMRRLGMQPMLPKTGNVTATASGIEAAKAHSAVGTWANGLKDALEQAFMFTAKWMKSTEAVEVSVHTDFSVGMWGVEEIRELREARAAGDLSQRTYWDELSRRGVLGPQFDPDKELDAILGEIPGGDDDDDIGAALPLPDPEARP
jgi:hypothetical protein